MITHCSPKQSSTSPQDPLLSEQSDTFTNGRPLPKVPLLSPKPVRAKPTLPPKLSDTEVLTYLNEGKRTNPAPTSLLAFYSNGNSPVKETTMNEDIYRTEEESYGLSLIPDGHPFKEEKLTSTSSIDGHSENLELARRKELPTPLLYKQRHSHTYDHPMATLSENSLCLLAEEVDTEKSDTTTFTRVQSTHLQDRAAQEYHDGYAQVLDPNPSKYGQLGNARSTKPLPKPRAVSGALEQTQSELKRAYFQVNSLQTQLASQKAELTRLKTEVQEYEATQTGMSSKLQKYVQHEEELKKELSNISEAMRLLRLENERLRQENENSRLEDQQRMEILNRQVNYLKVELIKSATFADSAINQISMGVANVNQVMEYLNGLGKVSTQD